MTGSPWVCVQGFSKFVGEISFNSPVHRSRMIWEGGVIEDETLNVPSLIPSV